MIVEIDHKSGFCFGVQNAIAKAEETLNRGGILYSLGHIVHNESEVNRLNDLGLKSITHEEFYSLSDCTVLIRAHGEPPSTYEFAKQNNIILIDATCPVVLKLQQRVRKAAESMENEGGQVIIFGHQGHAEVNGLIGQTQNKAVVVDHPDDIQNIDLSKPLVLFSQTTKAVADFRKLADNLKNKSQSGRVEAHDTICRQVSNRVPHLESFAVKFDVIVFVGGKSSSNAQVLYQVCKQKNSKSYFISSPEELSLAWFSGAQTVGVCGATSTPQWLMEKVADRIKQF